MRSLALIAVLVAVPVAAAQEEVVVHPPDQSGAWTSDTDFSIGGISYSHRLADNFTLDSVATIRRITWWGDYAGTVPPANETMRIRIYQDADGLPGNVLIDLTAFNPLREATGLLVQGQPGTSSKFPEYLLQVDLAAPITLNAQTPYWLEIAQIGDLSSEFQWEFSSGEEDGFGFLFPSDGQWQLTSFGKDLAFELSAIPEPCTLSLITLAIALKGRRRLGCHKSACP